MRDKALRCVRSHSICISRVRRGLTGPELGTLCVVGSPIERNATISKPIEAPSPLIPVILESHLWNIKSLAFFTLKWSGRHTGDSFLTFLSLSGSPKTRSIVLRALVMVNPIDLEVYKV